MPKSAYLILPLLLAGCMTQPDDSRAICDAALQGMSDPGFDIYERCINEVWTTGFKARQEAANKYRNMPR